MLTIRCLFSGNDKLITLSFEDNIRKSFHVNQRPLIQLNNRKLYSLNYDEVHDSVVFKKRINEILYDDNAYWVVTYENEIYKYSSFENLFQEKGLHHGKFSNRNISALLYRENLSIATENSGIVITDSNFNTLGSINSENLLLGDWVNAQFIDHQGNLWLALNKGIARVNFDNPIAGFDKSYGINSTIEHLYIGQEGFYMATHQGFKYQQRGFEESESKKQFLDTKEEALNIQCWDVLPLNTPDQLLIITNNGLALYEKGRVQFLKSCEAYRLYQSAHDKNIVYIGYNGGVYKLDKQSLEISDYAQLGDIVFSLAEDSEGYLWCGSYSGGTAYKLTESDKGVSVNTFSKAEGLSSEVVILEYFKDRLLYGTDDGVYVHGEQGFSPHDKIHELIGTDSIYIHRFSVDYQNNLWIVYHDNKSVSWQICYIDSSLSTCVKKPFMSNNIQGSIIHAIAHERNGRTWLGGSDGLFLYDAKRKIDYNKPFNVAVRSVEIKRRQERGDSSSVDGTKTIFYGHFADTNGKAVLYQPEHFVPIIDYSQNSVGFTYAAQDYQSEFKEYSYFLEGFDPDWSAWSKESKKEYTFLPEGEYIFRIKARNVYGNMAENYYKFRIKPPWYRTNYAYAGFSLTIILLTILVSYIWTGNLRTQIRLRTKEIESQKNIIESKNKSILSSLDYASRIQRSILPNQDIMRKAFPNAFALLKPRDIVSGDFYWYMAQDDKMFFTVADCTGHGVPGALMSMIGTRALNEIMLEKKLEVPAEILDELRHAIIQTFSQSQEQAKDGIDMSFCCWDQKSNLLEFAGAYNSLLVLRSSDKAMVADGAEQDADIEKDGIRLYDIKGDKIPVAFSEDLRAKFSNKKVELVKGDTLYLFSDGYPDQFGGELGKKLKYRPFKELLIKTSQLPLKKQKEALMLALIDWMGDYEQVDDICVMGVKV